MAVKQTWLGYVIHFPDALAFIGGKKDLRHKFFCFLTDYHEEIKYLRAGLTITAPAGPRLYRFRYRVTTRGLFYGGLQKEIKEYHSTSFGVAAIKDYMGFDICSLIE